MPMQEEKGRGGTPTTHSQPGTMEWVVSTMLRPPYPWKGFRMLDGSVWTARKVSTPPEFDPWIVQSLASRY